MTAPVRKRAARPQMWKAVLLHEQLQVEGRGLTGVTWQSLDIAGAAPAWAESIEDYPQLTWPAIVKKGGCGMTPDARRSISRPVSGALRRTFLNERLDTVQWNCSSGRSRLVVVNEACSWSGPCNLFRVDPFQAPVL
jgi:hypothetical protein